MSTKLERLCSFKGEEDMIKKIKSNYGVNIHRKGSDESSDIIKGLEAILIMLQSNKQLIIDEESIVYRNNKMEQHPQIKEFENQLINLSNFSSATIVWGNNGIVGISGLADQGYESSWIYNYTIENQGIKFNKLGSSSIIKKLNNGMIATGHNMGQRSKNQVENYDYFIYPSDGEPMRLSPDDYETL